MKLFNADNREALKELPDNSVDSVITDPPYALTSIKKRFGKEGSAEAQYGTDGAFQRASKGFMGKEWDAEVPSVEFWREVYRVLKPGGHILSFGGTRTYHKMVVNMEHAGFEIRDQIMWIYGSGFPKSLNIGKAIDKFGGNNLLSTEIGSKLKEARTSRGLTLKQADELFCGGTSNYNWLEGRSDGQRIPNQELFDKIVNEWPELKDLRNKVIASDRELLGVEITNKTVMKNIGDTNVSGEYERTKGQTEWEGWGTALKPAVEPICLARKPLSEKSISENVLRWRTGGINIDGCRVGYTNEADKESAKPGSLNATGENSMFGLKSGNEQNDTGRFPANVILECICDEVIQGERGEPVKSKGRDRTKHEYNSVGNNGSYDGTGTIDNYKDKGDIHTNPDCPCYILDEQSGVKKSCKRTSKYNKKTEHTNTYTPPASDYRDDNTYSDKGGASRFFYKSKVSKLERNLGLDEFEENEVIRQGLAGEKNNPIHKNNHPTLKPINLLTYLCRLITPPKGVVLDPFMGSGSTGIAALLEGFDFIGMELDKDYYEIAQKRIENYELYRKLLK